MIRRRAVSTAIDHFREGHSMNVREASATSPMVSRRPNSYSFLAIISLILKRITGFLHAIYHQMITKNDKKGLPLPIIMLKCLI